MDRRTLPTVIVARRAAHGREFDFERWLRRLADAAGHAPGHLGAEIQPPDTSHPSEWVIVYRFESVACLDDWLGSDERRELLHEGGDLVDGAAREQIIATGTEADAADPVTAVASFRLRPDAVSELAGFYRRLLHELASFDGYLQCDLFEPVPGVQVDTVIVFAFDTRSHLDAWLESHERNELLATLDPHLDSERVLNVVGGFGGWFGPGAVRRWKQASIVLLALFPTSLAIGALRGELLPDLRFVPAVFVSNVIGIAILTWVLMPWLTRIFDRWLRS